MTEENLKKAIEINNLIKSYNSVSTNIIIACGKGWNPMTIEVKYGNEFNYVIDGNATEFGKEMLNKIAKTITEILESSIKNLKIDFQEL